MCPPHHQLWLLFGHEYLSYDVNVSRPSPQKPNTQLSTTQLTSSSSYERNIHVDAIGDFSLMCVCVCVWHLFIRTNETNWQTQVAGQQPQKAAEQRRNGSVKVNQCHSNKFPLCLMELPLMRCESAQCMTNSYTKVSYIVEYRIIICGLSAMTSETPLFSMKAFLAAQYWISMVGNVMRQQKKKINTLHIIQI